MKHSPFSNTNFSPIGATAKSLALALGITLGLVGCSSGGGSGPEVADSEELRSAAQVVSDTAGLPSCTADNNDTLYYLAASNSYRTCVNQGGEQGYVYVELNTERSPYDGAEQVLSFRYRDRLPWCGWWRRGLVAYVSSSKELKFCGKKRGYRWWYVWKDLDIRTNSTNDGACSVVEKSPGVRTITCGDSSADVYDGKDGADGADGADGQDGADGAPGPQGPQGDSGTDGADGAKGDKGEPGAPGSDGADGEKGEKGEPGANGSNGADGEKGEKGEPGAPGSDGTDGEKGDKGEPGVDGSDGADGAKGDKGEPGVDGSDGADGAKGDKGEKGDKGVNGSTGPQGDKGEQGDQGPKGTTGDKGTNGKDGDSCTLVPNPDGTHTLKCGDDSIVVGNQRQTFAQMSSGWFHTCGVSEKGEVWCWGSNEYGQLGRNLPTGTGAKAEIGKVPGLSGVKKLASGYYHTCALTKDSEVYCWGSNHLNQLSALNISNIPSPAMIAGFSGANDIAASTFKTCTIGADSQVRCVGAVKLTGSGPFIGATPTVVPGFSGIAQLVVGNQNMCGVAANGEVLCRGSNLDGALGQPSSTTFLATPTAVPAVSGIQQLAYGTNSYCALNSIQQVICWGRNAFGQMGLALPPLANVLPQQITALPSTKHIHSGSEGFCATSTAGELRCWGGNTQGQLGLGSVTPPLSTAPQLVIVGSNSTVDAFFADPSSATRCLKTTDRRIHCWGRFDSYPKDTIPTAQPAVDYGPWQLDLSDAEL